ncbi:glutamine--tRNA ligase/YqeY domain fusion protein [Roseiconus lacunae]|uniref:Glutamine--tRNA ligase n=1 Tax=Roseiconus lacunae TaxID=2605694 RepID=A0ABT7PLT0_9BACT|nr:glutamine--tRNA ligase/YqeY domain fusion protein [Roseiconus lacunae]MCD0458098.1 glutamine--tRNA ligase/YqeY domain fusion protein [Roseiconus lacunae]MDM4017462.1 glutamine--tRNA ligase/YqeY domain fusion protein [Roseiconus lacunae]WRQ53711.1 glutamine--tRNA ligase/YqeY domain fusion protein [Stieleria sp. HD01]
MNDKANDSESASSRPSKHFIEQAIDADLAANKAQGVFTRFPPEPNGYLHIGHAKSICLNFGLAKNYNGTCNLRFDDTNPSKEETEYVESIQEDVRWLGFQWDSLHYASDYFGQLFEWAEKLIKAGKAYVCDLTAEETRQYRGSLTEPGKNSPFRNRSPEENLDLFHRMKAGEFPDGTKTLRAKIDMASPNLNLRDPVMYRIMHAHHHRTGDQWCIYPMYDWAHGQSDSIEGITFSICTLEFENHRPLYNWYCESLGIHHPRQIEFARLNMTYTVMSKRKLLQLVKENHVSGWDDPRMPTISGLRRRGYTPESIRNFATDVGVAKFNSTIDVIRLENAVREHLNRVAPRRMVVFDPIKLTITNWPEGKVEMMNVVNNPEDESAGTREVPFSGSLLIGSDDFREEAPRKFFRLKKGGSVRLRGGYIIDCQDVVKDDDGNIVEILCTYDPETKSGQDNSGRKVKGTIHWVSADPAVPVEVRNYDRLFATENPDQTEDGKTFLDNMNPNSLEVTTAYAEPEIESASAGDRFQFERLGYYVVDPDSDAEKLVFNRIVPLRDSWGKMVAKGKAG